MDSIKLQEIMHSIAEPVLPTALTDGVDLGNLFQRADVRQRLSHAFSQELDIRVSPHEIGSSSSWLQLAILVEPKLARDPKGQTLVEVYAIVERLAREEYHRDINFHWRARWDDFLDSDGWITVPDSLDAVEIVMRIEDEFGFGISDQDAQSMKTVEQTIRYLWNRSYAQVFSLRQPPEVACRSVFVFNEIRRLIVLRAGVSREAIQLNARLGDLLPSWYSQFWDEIQDHFHVDLPARRLFGLQHQAKRATVGELVDLIISSPDK